jgi:hypothetical protein
MGFHEKADQWCPVVQSDQSAKQVIVRAVGMGREAKQSASSSIEVQSGY